MNNSTTPTLTTNTLHHKTLNKAGVEALKNAQLIALAGFIEEAYQITSTLLGLTDDIHPKRNTGWQINQNTGFVHEVIHVHQVLCWLHNKPFPSIAREDAMGLAELEEDAETTWKDLLSELTMTTRMQLKPAGQVWNEAYFDNLKKMQPNKDGIYTDYGLFSDDLDWLMRYRLHEIFDNDLSKSDFGILSALLGADIKVSKQALDYDIHWLVDTLSECNQNFMQQMNSNELGYMEVNIFQSMLIIDLLGNHLDLAKKQLSRLLFSDDFYQDVFKLYYCPLFKSLALQGVFADIVGVNKLQVDAYLASFYTRDEVAVQAMNSTPSKHSTNSIDYADLTTIKSILRELKTDNNSDSYFAKELLALPMSEVTIPDEPGSSEGKDSMIVFRFPNTKTKTQNKEKSWKKLLGKSDKDTSISQTNPVVKSEEDWKALWQFAHELMVKTNRYPVLVMEWGLINDDDWENFVERGVYEDEDFDGDRVGLSARELARGAENVDLPATLRAIAIGYGADVEEFLEYECGIEDKDLIAELVASFEESANDDDGDDEGKIDFIALAKRAFANEVATHGKPDGSPEHLTWFLPNSTPNSYDEAYLLLLPTQNAWEVPAYVNFYGAGSYGTEVLIAQLKQWHEQYGMQVHWALGTMMNITVEKQPSTEEEAVELAYIQHLLAPSTYAPSGFSMSEYAMTLMQSDKWFLHERP